MDIKSVKAPNLKASIEVPPLAKFEANVPKKGAKPAANDPCLTPNTPMTPLTPLTPLTENESLQTGRFSHDSKAITRSYVPIPKKNSDSDSLDEDLEINKLVETKSWKTLMTQDKGCNIKWSDISFPSDDSKKRVIIGTGTFGTVVRAVWKKPKGLIINQETNSNGSRIIEDAKDVEVAIKVLTAAHSTNHSKIEFESLRYRAHREAAIMVMAKKVIKSTQHIIDAYGMIEGPLPQHVTSLLHLPPNEPAICLVLRFEGGGSLNHLINVKNKEGVYLPMREKLRLLFHIISGINELHTNGVVHADIKPDNVLLSTEDPPVARLADFGLSIVSETIKAHSDKRKKEMKKDEMKDGNLSPERKEWMSNIIPEDSQSNQRSPRSGPIHLSAVANTARTQGTLTYCAPEMLVNPYLVTMNVNELASVATSSRRTDIYAFAILAWQLLSQRRPFHDIKGEVMLCSQVHLGYRPPLNKLPKDTPLDIINMIVTCWDEDRSKRLTANDCLQILQKTCAISIHSSMDNISTSRSLTGSNFGLVVPLPSFDRPKSSTRSSSIHNSPQKDKDLRKSTDTLDTVDSQQNVTLDFTSIRAMLNVKIRKSPGASSEVTDDNLEYTSIYSMCSMDTDEDESARSNRSSTASTVSTISNRFSVRKGSGEQFEEIPLKHVRHPSGTTPNNSRHTRASLSTSTESSVSSVTTLNHSGNRLVANQSINNSGNRPVNKTGEKKLPAPTGKLVPHNLTVNTTNTSLAAASALRVSVDPKDTKSTTNRPFTNSDDSISSDTKSSSDKLSLNDLPFSNGGKLKNVPSIPLMGLVKHESFMFKDGHVAQNSSNLHGLLSEKSSSGQSSNSDLLSPSHDSTTKDQSTQSNQFSSWIRTNSVRLLSRQGSEKFSDAKVVQSPGTPMKSLIRRSAEVIMSLSFREKWNGATANDQELRLQHMQEEQQKHDTEKANFMNQAMRTSFTRKEVLTINSARSMRGEGISCPPSPTSRSVNNMSDFQN